MSLTIGVPLQNYITEGGYLKPLTLSETLAARQKLMSYGYKVSKPLASPYKEYAVAFAKTPSSLNDLIQHYVNQGYIVVEEAQATEPVVVTELGKTSEILEPEEIERIKKQAIGVPLAVAIIALLLILSSRKKRK
jgi:hypothetical protein